MEMTTNPFCLIFLWLTARYRILPYLAWVCGDAMIRTKDVLNCLPLVASILGDRYGVQVRISGKPIKAVGSSFSMAAMSAMPKPSLLMLPAQS